MKAAKPNSTFYIFNGVKGFKVGDKVRLIDETAECEVSRIISDNSVAIRDENGFEYTVNVREIVPLFKSENLSPAVKTDIVPENIIPVIQTQTNSLLRFFGNTSSLFLCAAPEKSDSLLNTPYSIYVVNTSEEIVLYSLHLSAVKKEAAYGILKPREETFAGSFSPRKVTSRITLKLKAIIHSAEKILIREFSFTSDDFTNEKLFHSNQLFIKHILSFDCFAQEEIKIPDEDITKLVDHFSPTQKKAPVKEKVQKRKNTDEPLLTNEKTVDLHIEELTDDYSLMSNADIITLQLNHFHKELDTAILKHYYRIIFIHGKGNGVLRNRIRTELDALHLKYRDADTSRFGYGATEVLL